MALLLFTLMVVVAFLLTFFRREPFVAGGKPIGHRRVSLSFQDPFGVAFTRDGKHVFVCGRSLGVYAISPTGSTRLHSTRRLPSPALGCAVSRSGEWLAVAFERVIRVYNIELVLQKAKVALQVEHQTSAKNIQVEFSPNDTHLVASQEFANRLSVFDATQIRQRQMRRLGPIQAGASPVGLSFIKTNGGTQLVVYTSQMDKKARASGKCTGSLRIANIETREVLDVFRAGCTPVRVDMAGTVAFTTARGRDKVNVLDVGINKQQKLFSFKTSPAPVGVKLAMGGRYLVVAASNRFDTKSKQGAIDIFDVQARKKVKTLSAGEFPREVAVSPDGNVAVVTNFASNSFDVLYLPALL